MNDIELIIYNPLTKDYSPSFKSFLLSSICENNIKL